MADILKFNPPKDTKNDKTAKMSEEVQSVYTNWWRVKQYYERAWNNCVENWRFYFAKNPELGHGQWPLKVVDSMLQQERQLLQYNFIKPTVDVMAGSIMEMPFDPEFIPTAMEVNSLVKAVKQAMYSDKELMDWKGAYYDLVLAGLIYEGCIKFSINRKYSDLGNISFDYQLPGSVFPDPAWKTWRSSDCEVVWKESWYTAEKAMEIYPEKSDVIKFMAERLKRDGVEYGENTGIVPYKTDSNEWGSSFRFIEEYRVLKKRIETEYVITPNEDIPIPNIPDDMKPAWLNKKIPEWQPDLIYSKPSVERVSVVKTICPTLVMDKLLENGLTEAQIGATPFKFWSATRANGESHSIVDSIKDPQMNLNFWESMLTHKLKVEGGGGAQFVDPSYFATREEYLDYCANRNKPTKNFETKPGAMDRGGLPARPVITSTFPTELYKNIEHIIHTIWPQISKVTPSFLGRTEQQQDMSGRLYGMLRLQSERQIFTILFGLRMFWNDVYEGYLMQAPQTYGNEGIERAFTIDKGREKITLNERIILPDGREAIKNDISKLNEMRVKVIISEKQDSPTEKADKVRTIGEIVKNLPPNRFATINFLTNRAIANVEQVPDEDKDELEMIGNKELERDMAVLDAEIANAKVQQAQAQAMLGGGQPPGAMPAPTGAQRTAGVPQEQGEPIQPTEPQAQEGVPL